MVDQQQEHAVSLAMEDYAPHQEPYYMPVGDEVQVFEAAYQERIPVLLKGPTGCGKTRFVEHMAWRLGTSLRTDKADRGAQVGRHDGLPLVTVACHEDLTASDLVGRYLLEG